MAPTSTHQRLFRTGLALAVAGFVLAMSGLALHASQADAVTEHVFEGNCISLTNSGVCVLDEPEGNNPAVHGLVSYLRATDTMTFTIDAADLVTEVQICMQASGPFAEGANVCAGSHGNHVAYTHLLSNVYTVDLDAAGLTDANPLYWTLHVVAGGRTLQVLGSVSIPAPTTTTTTPAPTTSTTVPSTTTSAQVTTTIGNVTTTVPPTTVPPTTTSAVAPTTTSVAPTTTSVAPTTTSVAPTTTSVAPTTTAPPSSTSTAAVSTTTSTTAVSSVTTTTAVVQVLPETLSRTGGPHWWMLLMGAALMLVGVTMTVATRVLDERG